MNRKNEKKLLDFCRVKKLSDKGFGFLISLYYEENVFFHFSKIKDRDILDSLNALKRGVVSVFFTSSLVNGKRKVDNIWLNAKDIPTHFLNDFIERLILELNIGKRNPFEIMDALNQLRDINKLDINNYKAITKSAKIKKNPSILLKLISNNEVILKKDLETLLDNWKGEYSLKVESEEILLNILTGNY